ncbi:MAG: adenosylcobalamin-dependent ribonucleoside-diphosphate reductase [Candidatus Marinimicrobia bacterium]|nr:adenosylcobalamin-dependent ribonucleoside-diphosphate reductase [Candidatus Neomarinimicrobiota bacterium]
MSFKNMFKYRGKFTKMVGEEKIRNYQNLYEHLQAEIEAGNLPEHDNYLNHNDLAENIYKKKYFLRDYEGNPIEHKPEDVFLRIASFMAAQETSKIKQTQWAEHFYRDLYNGHWIAGGRVLAGAGDLYRLKTLANCFVTGIEHDNIESIYKTAAECARTYSYGGGIGVDITPLRPRDSIVHNAADSSTGAVSFMDLFSMTTGLIGQSGRRGALMLTIDIKHPDIEHFIKVKKAPNWVTNQVVEQCRWSNKFSEEQLSELKKQVVENTQIRFANTSIKTSDEFMQAVKEETDYKRDTIMVYRKRHKLRLTEALQDDGYYYSLGIPSKDINDYELLETFGDTEKLNIWLEEHFDRSIRQEDLDDKQKRDVYGDYLMDIGKDDWEIAIKYAGDFLLYFASAPSGEIRNLVKARDIWNLFVESNYHSAEPGLIFWSQMSKYSPSNYVGKPIISTNPCAEVPLEDGGACNLGSINLSRFVNNGFTDKAKIDWEQLRISTGSCIRFLDNVVTWNETLNPLEKQREASNETRRLGLGIMGIADMFFQLGIDYDSEMGVETMEEIMSFINDTAYRTSSELAKEKGPSDIFVYKDYSQCPFFTESLSDETKEHIKQFGLRNIALTSIAPTGSISNIIKSFEIGKENYIGVSGGIEPLFALFYTRRAESFDNQLFQVFHSTLQAYLDLNNLNDKIQDVKKEFDLEDILPSYFFKTAHTISYEKRIQIQSVCQRYIDHSISSTINLPEDIEPEIISTIYLDAWSKGLKGITIYRDGSRFPILSVESEKTDFQEFREKRFEMEVGKDEVLEFTGDEIMVLEDGTLSTPFHYFRKTMGVTDAKEIEVV